MDQPYRISTITATGSVNTEIDLDVFYDNIKLVDASLSDQYGIIYAEYGKKKSDTMYKGTSKKTSKKASVQTQTATKSEKTKRFDNQVTIVYRINDKNLLATDKNCLNIKIFRNGNIQITGIKYIRQGEIMIDIVIGILTDIYDSGQTNIVLDKSKLQNVNYKIRLINSDFKVGFPIKRELLYKVCVQTYENDCSFEPCIYPGVKIRYYFNEDNHIRDGLCHCGCECDVGKGSGKGEGQCKKITIAVFQSGCVIITGAQSPEQISEAYTFINRLIMLHQNDIEKRVILPVNDPVEPTKKYMINKKNIIYPDWYTC